MNKVIEPPGGRHFGGGGILVHGGLGGEIPNQHDTSAMNLPTQSDEEPILANTTDIIKIN